MTNIKAFLTALFTALGSLSVVAQEAILPAQFQELINKQENVQLLDVRTAGEFAGGYLKGALNVDVRSASFAEDISTMDKDRPVFVYCLSGGRSASAARQLVSMGYTEVYDMKGGMMAWKRAELPIETVGTTAKPAGTSKAAYDKLIQTDVPVLVNFFAPWCGPCRKMKPMLEALETEAAGKFNYVKLNADENDALMKVLGVSEIPTLFVYKNGEISWQQIGLVEKDVLVKELGL